MSTRLSLQNATLWLTTFWASIFIGANVYQMLVIVPVFAANPPESVLAFNQSGVQTADFWANPYLSIGHLVLIVSLILHWRTNRFKWLGFAFLLIVLGNVVTFAYFYPRLALLGFLDGTIQTENIPKPATAVKEFVVPDVIRFVVLLVPAFFLLLKAISLPVVRTGAVKETTVVQL